MRHDAELPLVELSAAQRERRNRPEGKSRSTPWARAGSWAGIRIFRNFTVVELVALVVFIAALIIAEQVFDIRFCGRHSEDSCTYVLFEPR